MSTPRTVLLGKVSLGLLVAVILVFALRSLARKTWGPFPDEEVVNLGPSTRGRPPIALEPDQLYFLADGTPSHMFVRTAKRSELRSFRASPSTLVGSIPAPEAQRVHDFRLVTTRSSVVVAGDLALPSMDGATDYPNKVWRMDKASGTSEELADLPRIGQPLLTSTADTAYYWFWDIEKKRHRMLAIRDGSAPADVPFSAEIAQLGQLGPHGSLLSPEDMSMFIHEGRMILLMRLYVGTPEHVFEHRIVAFPLGGGPMQTLDTFLDGPAMSFVTVAPAEGGVSVLRGSKSVTYQSRHEIQDSRIYVVSFAGVRSEVASVFASHDVLFAAGRDLYTTDCRVDSRPDRCPDVVVVRLRAGRREVLGSLDWASDFGEFVAADDHDLFFGTASTLFRFRL